MKWGKQIHKNKERVNLTHGEKKKGYMFDKIGQLISLVYNLIASEKGWRIPLTPTLLGPNRICINPKILRSKSVIKATLTRLIIMETTIIEIWIKLIEI